MRAKDQIELAKANYVDRIDFKSSACEKAFELARPIHVENALRRKYCEYVFTHRRPWSRPLRYDAWIEHFHISSYDEFVEIVEEAHKKATQDVILIRRELKKQIGEAKSVEASSNESRTDQGSSDDGARVDAPQNSEILAAAKPEESNGTRRAELSTRVILMVVGSIAGLLALAAMLASGVEMDEIIRLINAIRNG